MAKDFMVKESELDDIQMRVLNSVLDKNIVVSGCAGSGKSVIALQKAKRVQNEKGGTCEVIVYTKALRNFMNSGREQLGLNCDFYYHWWWKHRLNKPKADYVIVDEIQDFTQEEIQELMASAHKHFFFFGDTAQSIYGGLKNTCSVKRIQFMAEEQGACKDFPLYYNYRLPKPIARITQDYIGVDVDPYGDGSVYKSKENKKPKLLQYPSLEDQLKAVVRMISNRNLTDVGILVRHNEDIPMVVNILRAAAGSSTLSRSGGKMQFEVKYTNKEDYHGSVETLNFNTDNPKVMTYHSAKGLQFETVFLPNINDPVDENWQKALYVAMTRTYRNLYMMYSGEMPDILRNVPADFYETTETDEVIDF